MYIKIKTWKLKESKIDTCCPQHHKETCIVVCMYDGLYGFSSLKLKFEISLLFSYSDNIIYFLKGSFSNENMHFSWPFSMHNSSVWVLNRAADRFMEMSNFTGWDSYVVMEQLTGWMNCFMLHQQLS